MKQRLINWINYHFWKTVYNSKNVVTVHNLSVKPYEHIIPAFDDDRINKAVTFDFQFYPHVENYIIVNHKTIIEPDNSYVISGFNKIIGESVFYPNLCPSLTKWIKFYFNPFKKKTKEFKDAIIFDGTIGVSNFHFFSNVFNKVWLLDRYNISKNIPVIIGFDTYNTTHFQFFYSLPEIKKLNWVVQNKTDFFSIGKAILLRTMPYDRDLWVKTASLTSPIKSNCSPFRRVFINRKSVVGRNIENWEQIKNILDKHKFEVIYLEDTPFSFQVKIFSETKYLISIHGGGETNIMFANPDELRFLEICPSNRIACQYIYVSRSLGIAYNCILGGPLPEVRVYPEKNFFLDPVKLEDKITNWLLLQK